MTGNSVAWVRRFGVQSMLRVIRATEEDALGLEVAKATELNTKYGWDNVRGEWITTLEIARSALLGSARGGALASAGAFAIA